ncbi:miniconductance mechanosensitive channel [Tenacibaculum skagerrakense]|uniref:Miniconductance mechanosensitive channel n=1 Tax=Tenacibaculum skagerrakense TaxID=186571 RepID=A0A4R2NQN1_9FLAO|nr:mechanosensitive ion channel domain-containing protein [Tenacibaculum skagerrakense]TCP23635.1 miniconductance mechanosensitive channel [Tenacibaculum skagerrakense]
MESRKLFYSLFADNLGVDEGIAMYLNVICNILVIPFLGYIIYRLVKLFGSKIIQKLASKTKTQFDDILIKNRTFLNLSRVIIFIITYSFLDYIFIDFSQVLNYAQKITNVCILISFILLIKSILSSIKDYLRTLTVFKDKPLESYVQIFMVFLWLIGVIISVSILSDRPLARFLTTLGAFSAVLLLIFKDAILGFVASIQISVYDTVRLQDWITMEKYGADGNIIEINLTSVIVQNFDNTITSIPTYSLISDSFKNWRAMNNSGGRRIKRAVSIKMSSIKFVSEDDIEKFSKIELISSYLKEKSEEIKNYNSQKNINKDVLINGRNLTNFGIFRKYIDLYLEQNPKINKELTLMTRQLTPTSKGIPLEIYAFSNMKEWVIYERIIADIFDHICASVSYFDLEIFESPTGNDLTKLKNLM